ncbi:hypothetical protein KPN7_24 [Klebsiella phage KPN7]|uniref:Uncharacterized protein n=1 Tax=Klebsiella phage KPN7 TaxID=2972462 RepID=A0A976XNG4_9CAUD|nr:hypothetical protein KPN7_24 [Klebsiella phage KPN7]
MSRDILNSLSFEMHYDDFSQTYSAYVYDTVTRELYGKLWVPHYITHNYVRRVQFIRAWIEKNLEEAWPTCESTLNMELRSRRTITSSCGRLTVTESPSLTVTCSRTS